VGCDRDVHLALFSSQLQILFPLMNEIRNLAGTAGKNRIDTELGKEGGKAVIMFVC